MSRHRAASWWYRGRHHKPRDPRPLLTSAAVGAATMALPPVLMSTLITPEAPATLPTAPAPPLALPPPTSSITPAPTQAVYTTPPKETEAEGVEPEPEPTPEPTPEPEVDEVEPQDVEPQPAPAAEDIDPGDIDSCPSLLDGTLPHVARAGWHLMNRFGIRDGAIIGRAPRSRASEHPAGLALDFRVDRATGDRLADYVLDNMDRLGVKYVIWRQRYNSGSGFRLMEDRGSVTANHYDHVHVSFRSSNDDAAELAC